MNRAVDNARNVPVFDGLSCILAAYNDQDSVSHTIRALVEVLDHEVAQGKVIGDYEIIVVDDASSDDTCREVQERRRESDRVKLIRHLQRGGFSAAVYDGLVSARFELMFLGDAGNQYDYSQIREFLVYAPEHDLLTGYRVAQQDSLARQINSWGWNVLLRLFFGRLPRDIDCLFKVLRHAALDKVNLIHLRGKDAIVNTELLVRLKRRKSRHIELPVAYFPSNRRKWAGSGIGAIGHAIKELCGLLLRLLAERVSWLGFVTGSFSRQDRPMEVTRYRRSMHLYGDEESITCPLCGADSGSLHKSHLHTCEDKLHLGDFSVIYCSRCRNGFTYPRLALADTLLEVDVPSSKLGPLEHRLLRWFAQIRVKRVMAALHTRRAPAVLDVGGGSCAFANAMAKAGAQMTVIEPNAENRQFAEPTVRFIPGIFSTALLEDGALVGESFDAVVMWHSLEHHPDPNEALHLAKRMLKSDGVLYVSVPNIDSFQAEMAQNYWAYLDVPHHISHFTMDGLVSLLRRAGFRQFRLHFFSLEYDIFGFYQTLLNMISRSHNYYYNIRKKNRWIVERYLRYPRWTRFVTVLGVVWLVPAVILSLYSAAVGKPACIEMYCCPDDSISATKGTK